MKITSLAIMSTGLVFTLAGVGMAQNQGTSFLSNPQNYKSLPVSTEEAAPKLTTKEKIDNLQSEFESTIAGLSSEFNKLPGDPSLILSDEVVNNIETLSRKLDSLQRSCAATRTELNTRAKSVSDAKTFSEEEKKELFEIAKGMDEQCAAMDKKISAAISHIKSSSTSMKEWRTVYKTYLNLQGKEKGAEKLKALVADYLKVLNEGPAEAAAEPAA